MNQITAERMSASYGGDFVVLLIGMRINRLWKVHKWWPTAMAMNKMLKELEQNPELGLLGHIPGFKVSVQYWKSFEHLENYARNINNEHLPAWKAFNQAMSKNRGDVGIWHETYQIKNGDYESVYSGMPPFGLGLFSTLTPASGVKTTARGRLTGQLSQQPD